MYILNVTLGLSGTPEKGESLAGCCLFLIRGIYELGKGKFVATLLAHISTICLMLGVGIVCEL